MQTMWLNELSEKVVELASEAVYWLLCQFGNIANSILGLFPDDPGYFKQIDVSVFNQYVSFIHYFIPFNFIVAIMVLSAELFLLIELALLLEKIIEKLVFEIMNWITNIIG